MRAWLFRHRIALIPPLVAVITLTLRFCFESVFRDRLYLILYPPTFFAALLLGFWPGVAATILAIACAWFFLLAHHNLEDYIGLTFFFISGIIFSLFGQRRLNVIRALVESKNKLNELVELNRQMLSTSLLAIAVYRVHDGQCIWANEQLTKLTGATMDSLLKQKFRQIESWRTSGLLAEVEKIISTGAKGQTSVHQRSTWGKDVYMDVALSTFENQGVNFLLVMAQDITERKKNELLLRANEKLFRAIFEQAAVGVAIINSHSGHFEEINQKYCDLLGYSRDYMLSKTIMDISHPDDIEEHKKNISQMRSGIIKDFSIEKRLLDSRGRPFWINLTVSPIFDSGDELKHHISIVENIDNRKRAEEELRIEKRRLAMAQRFASAGVWEWDFNTKEIVCSPELLILFGFNPTTSGPHYELWLRVLHPEDRERFLSHVEHLDPHIQQRHEYRIIKPDGTMLWILAVGDTEVDSSGKAIRSVGICIDITAQKQLEENLRKAVIARDEFLSIASHELKTPLTSLSLQLQLLLRFTEKKLEANEEQIPKFALKAYKSSQQILNLLNDLLDTTRIRAGIIQLKKQKVDLNQELSKILTLINDELKNSGSEVSVSSTDTVVGNWDLGRIDQIITNLLSNAIKYGRGKPIAINIKRDTEHNKGILEIRDQGIGIDQALLPKIFDRFERAVAGEQMPGLGLGLYIVRQLTELHGGSVRAESKLGDGSCFTLELPLE